MSKNSQKNRDKKKKAQARKKRNEIARVEKIDKSFLQYI